MERRDALALIAQHIAALHRPHPLRVAIDGIDAAGKTILADDLVRPVEEHGRPVIRASLDGFHRPRAERYRQGENSPQGYYEDSFDHAALRQAFLLPLGPGGSRRYRRIAFNYRGDIPAPSPIETAPENAVLLFDGIFLLRPELDPFWDYRIFVDVAFEVALQRALVRDAPHIGSPTAVQARYTQRYFPAQRLYLETIRPHERADVVVKNDDPDRPEINFIHGTSG